MTELVTSIIVFFFVVACLFVYIGIKIEELFHITTGLKRDNLYGDFDSTTFSDKLFSLELRISKLEPKCPKCKRKL